MSHVLHDKVTPSAHDDGTRHLAVDALPTEEKPPESEKGSDAGHGNRFQSKLLMLFCIRAINEGYKFYLGTELLDQGNKFDDLIFKFTKDEDAKNTEENCPNQYLQAKSRLHEKRDKITAEDLFGAQVTDKKKRKDTKINVDFSLSKYFRSYREITRRGDKIDSCIICTNIDFADKENLKKNGIEVKEVQLSDPILKFDKLSDKKIPTRYKLEIKSKSLSDILKKENVSTVLAKILCQDVKLNSKSEIIRNYHMALINEKVIDLETTKFHKDFINESDGLSEGAQELRKNILKLVPNDNSWKSWEFNFDQNFGKKYLEPKIFNYRLPVAVKDEEIKGFLDKLIFAVNTPNEGELDDVLKREVGNYFKLLSTDLQSAYVMNEMVNWFKRENNIWLSSEESKELFLNKTQKIMESIRVNEISIDYQNQLKNDLMGLEFNSNSIQIMKEKLRPLLEASSSPIIIGSESSQHTACKLIAAIKTLPDFKCDDSFLVTSSKRLEDEMEIKKFQNCLELKKDCHNLLVIVCNSEVSLQSYMKYVNLIPGGKTDNKMRKVVIVSPDNTGGITDEIKFTDLTDEFKGKILSIKVSFQLKKGLGEEEMENNKITVGELIGHKPEEVIDFSSLKELTETGGKLIIPSFDDTTHFEEHMYIKRQLKFALHDKFEDELATSLGCTVNQLHQECRIHTNGHIEWFVGEKFKKGIWNKISNFTNQTASSAGEIPEKKLIPFKGNGKEKSDANIVIISGVAGSGKSTLLSHYYREIKKENSDHWIIRINLVDHQEAILKLNSLTVYLADAIHFFVNLLHIVSDKNSFSRSLFCSRLQTGDRIVVMFDGFDEINDQCQDKIIHLMKTITKEKPIKLYVTTRPHMVDDLQLQLSQLAYSLEKFTEKNQVDYLASYWKNELKLSGDNDGNLQQFAKSLVDQVSETLKDKESSFIGIPLQCRIVAECFQSQVSSLIHREKYDEGANEKLIANRFDCQRFDLANLYERLMEKKRRVFREEKTKTSGSSVYNIDHLIKDIEVHLTKLAIETIVTDHKISKVLWPSQSSHRSDDDVAEEEKITVSNGLKFGLTFKSGDDTKVQFLHRTYAEYLFARYLYKAFLLDDKRHNKLLENESIRMLILNKILARPEYDGVQVFFNSMLKELVDDDKEWHNRIDSRNLPDRIKKFTKNFYDQFFFKFPPPKVTVDYLLTTNYPSSPRYDFENALHFSLSTGKQMIFTFLCDCLDATLDNKLIKTVILKSFMDKGSYFTFAFFRNTENKIFQRFIDYLDADTFLSKLTHLFLNLPPCNLEYSQWNHEEQIKTVHHLLQFMNNERKTFEKYFCISNEQEIEPMLTFLIFNENYESNMKIFLELLSRSKDYSNDSKFANLLKTSFCSKKHFVGGRIEKALAVLRDLKRNNVLMQMGRSVLTKEPKAYRTIYQPLPLVEADVTANDLLSILTQWDSYGMTRLHGAAFHGNTEAVEQLFEKIRQNLTPSERGNVAHFMVNGCTPFYVAAACGQQEIYRKMLAFLKQTLQSSLEQYVRDTNGFVHRALYDAIEAGNVQMLQLILKAVGKELGQNELIRILPISLLLNRLNSATPPPPVFPISNSLIVKKESKELFNAIAKIFATRDDDRMDYGDLNDLVFRDFIGKLNLKYIDAENLQGLLLLKGVEEFTKQLLDNSRKNFGFHLLSTNLLRHFTKDQLQQFVETITCKNNLKKFQTKELEHHREIHAERRVPAINSYWRDCITLAAELNFTYCEDGFGKLELILDIFDCLKEGGVSERLLKKLLLHEEENGFIMIHLSLKAVERMLTSLSTESQEEVKRKWKNDAPSMDTLFSCTTQLQDNDSILFTARHWANILRFYLEYGNEVHLKIFVKIVTSLRQIGTERRSVWSYIFENCNKEETNEILKVVWERDDILGRDAVKTMLLHKIDDIPLIIKSMVWGEEIDDRLEIMPKKIKEEIRQFVKINAPDFIDQAFLHPQNYLNIYISQLYCNRLNILISFLNYSNENQLKQFLRNITSLHFVPNKKSAPIRREHTFSIWAELFAHDCNDYKKENIAKMDRFMKIVSEKFGSSAVKELMLHQDGERPVIFYPASRREKKLLNTLISYLTTKDREMVQRQVDKFLG